MSVIVNNSPVEDYAHPDDHAPRTYENDSWVKTFLINTDFTLFPYTTPYYLSFHPNFSIYYV